MKITEYFPSEGMVISFSHSRRHFTPEQIVSGLIPCGSEEEQSLLRRDIYELLDLAKLGWKVAYPETVGTRRRSSQREAA